MFEATKISFNYKNIVNFIVIYEKNTWLRDLSTDFTLVDSMFGDTNVTRNADPDKYRYSDAKLLFYFQVVTLENICVSFWWSSNKWVRWYQQRLNILLILPYEERNFL